jgi:hypothetical protein
MTIATDISSASTAANAIDPTFPVAGQDNNSQGFRENFNNTQVGLQKTVTVITELNNTTAKLNADNNFQDNILENAEVRRLYGSVSVNGNTPAPEFIDAREAQYFTYTIKADLALTFSQWPVSDRFAKIYIDVRSDGLGAWDLDFATTSGTVRPQSTLTLPFTINIDGSTRHIFEAWTINGGNDVFLKHVGNFA